MIIIIEEISQTIVRWFVRLKKMKIRVGLFKNIFLIINDFLNTRFKYLKIKKKLFKYIYIYDIIYNYIFIKKMPL